MKRGLIHTGTIMVTCHGTDEERPINKGDLQHERREPITESSIRHAFHYTGPVLVYAALIFYLSSLSYFPETVPSFFGFDTIAHFLEYFFFGCLLCRWLYATDRYRQKRYAFLMTMLIGAVYALSDEWHQSFVPGRDASLWDALFDAAGVVTGAATYPLILQSTLPGRERSRKKAGD